MNKDTIGKTDFTFLLVSKPEELAKLFHLRYQVYCNECGFLKPEDYPSGLENDRYDPHSLQFAIYDTHGMIGGVRLILDSILGFPLEEHCGSTLDFDINSLPRNSTAEISRLVISKEYRRRKGDNLYYGPDFKDKSRPESRADSSMRVRPMVFGLYRELYQESKRRGITHWYALMEESLWILLKVHGFIFRPIGKEIDFYGPVRPYLASIEEIEQSVCEKYPEFFQEFFLQGLEKEYFPDTMRQKEKLDVTQGIFEEFSRIAKEFSGKIAVCFKRAERYQSFSYQEVFYKAVRFGNFLCMRGVAESERILLFLSNGPEWPIVFLSIQYCKAIAVPVDLSLAEEELQSRIIHCNPRMVICETQTQEKIKAVLIRANLTCELVVVDQADVLLQVESASAEVSLDRHPVSVHHPAIFFYTSGTTGLPKAVMLSHKNLEANVRSIEMLGLSRPDNIVIALLPLYHCYSFMVTFLIPILRGATISYPAGLNTDDFLECIRETKVNIIVGVPQLFALLHKNIQDRFCAMPFVLRWLLMGMLDVFWFLGKVFGLNLNKKILVSLQNIFGTELRFMISGGARLEPRIIRDFFKWGFIILEGYGLTEASPIVSWNTPKNLKIGSVGKPIPFVEVRIENPNKKGVGEIAVQGPSVMLGYYNENRQASFIARGWLRSEDVGYVDQQGFLHIVGRKDDIIVLNSGKKVNPEEVEAYYARSPFIREMCVFSVKKRGLLVEYSQLMAVIVPETHCTQQPMPLTEETIRKELSRLSKDLSEYKRVHRFVIHPEPLPRTNMGKLRRNILKERYSGLEVSQGRSTDLPRKEDKKLLESEISQRVLQYLAERFQKEVHPEDHLEFDLGLDSLSRIELLLELEKRFHITISESAASEIAYQCTVREMLLRIEAEQVQKNKEER